MDYKSLEKKLYILNDKETIYKTQTYPSPKEYTGEVYFYKFTPETDGQEYFISKQNRFRPVTPHLHGTCEINYIYSGEFVQYINGEKIKLQKGDIIILDKKVVHSIEGAGEKDILINIQMQSSFFNLTFLQQLWGNSIVGDTIASIISDKQDNNYIIFHTNRNIVVRQSIKNILCEYYDHLQIGSQQMINAHMMILFGQLLRSTQYYVDMISPIPSKSVSIASILHYIETNYVEGSLEKTANHFLFSPTHISRILKKSTGKSFKELVHEQRLKQAIFLLKSTNLPAYSIAEQVGYTNLNYFYLKFKEKYGVLPKEYKDTLSDFTVQ
ncbi:AraC family transcriptional regulator [Clostridium sp. YIM B02506]|uniref:AraC family transcriptional regulator n=1 Tax=Clostridium sp. YIM B02506 TaxID=2910680 RepID=UPI001EED7A98|nr:AraC family transcriptional regulator [Clostridium sp. YIM B02506]